MALGICDDRAVPPRCLLRGGDQGAAGRLGRVDRIVHRVDAKSYSRGDCDWTVAEGVDLKRDATQIGGVMFRSVAVLLVAEFQAKCRVEMTGTIQIAAANHDQVERGHGRWETGMRLRMVCGLVLEIVAAGEFGEVFQAEKFKEAGSGAIFGRLPLNG